MGSFPDFHQAADIVVSPQGMSIEVQPKTVQVNTLSAKQFSGVVSLNTENVEIQANKWQDVNATVKNRLNSALIVPIEAFFPNGFEAENTSRTILLQPLEEKEINWKIFVERELAPNQYLQGKYVAISAHPEIEKTIRVTKAKEEESERDIAVVDIIAVTEGNTLKIEITLENKGNQEKEAEIAVSQEEKEVSRKTHLIEANSTKKITIKVSNYSQKKYIATITAQGLYYVESILPAKAIEKPAEESNGTSPEPKLDDALAEAEKLATPENMLIAVVAFVAIALVFLLKELLFR